MKTGSLCDDATARALAVAWLIAAVRPVSAYGERAFAGVRPFARGQEARAQARARAIAGIAASADGARLDAAAEALQGVPDVAGAIARAALGDLLADADFLELLQFGDAVERVDAQIRLVAGAEPIGSEATASLRTALEPGRTGKYGFYLADRFGAALPDARAAVSAAQRRFEAARAEMFERVGRQLGREDLDGDAFVVMRDELRGALPAGVRVLREGPAYALCTVELDAAAMAALEQRDGAGTALAAAEARARAALSRAVADLAPGLDAAARALGELDVTIAAARFAQRYDCRAAEIVADSVLAFEGGRFLPLAAEMAAEGGRFVPIDVELADVAVLTGPNMGGKSVCLRTCGFIALGAAFGLPVPAVRARSGLFDEIAWLGIGSDDGRPGGLLSSFAAEVVRVRDVLARGARRPFVLIDEFARTTTPPEAKALLVALLERLRARGARGMAATHLAGVAASAGVRHFAVRGLRGIPEPPPAHDLRRALAALAASMDYSIAEVRGDRAGGADALALAALLGLDPDLVAGARRHLLADAPQAS